MEEEIEELEGSDMSKDQRLRAEEIGVVWYGPEKDLESETVGWQRLS
jgi:hypothetical protein